MLNDLHNWAIHAQYGHPICWLHGPAGAGKSAIMQTLCERLHRSGRFGGAFFFKREHAVRGNARVLFATLAYQLALNVLELKPLISQSVEADPSVVGRGMDFQLQKAIVEPCSALQGTHAAVLLIDGLDECDTPEVQAEILRVIASAVRQHPQRFRFLIASRPEAHICEVIQDISRHLIQDINVEQSFHDVETYFRDQFSRIHREHRDTMKDIPAPWPSEQIIGGLVRKSSGYFIYASTVIKFIDDKYSRPTEQLEAVQNLSNIDSDSPFAALDQLYIQILSGVPARFRCRLRDILVFLPRTVEPRYVDLIFEMEPGETELILRPLRSVIDVDSRGNISACHASFHDFLQNPRRSSDFHPDLKNRNNVVRAMLKALCDDSKREKTKPLFYGLYVVIGILEHICALPPLGKSCASHPTGRSLVRGA
ncbi:hypothetical protein C8R47DRAFT_751222 [Mycena vitilis]|nr:hypothetical protein C8R47DRAFT_751222 [Mycena vitilis]